MEVNSLAFKTFFTASCVLHKTLDFLFNPRSSQRSKGSYEKRKISDSGNDVWSWTWAPSEGTKGEEEKWKILPQGMAITDGMSISKHTCKVISPVDYVIFQINQKFRWVFWGHWTGVLNTNQ